MRLTSDCRPSGHMLHNAMTVAMNQGVFCNCFMTCNQKLKYKSETYLEFFGMIFGL